MKKLSQLSFQISNNFIPSPPSAPPPPNTIYITSDLSQNQLELTLTINTGNVEFTPGSGPLSLDQASTASYSLIYLDLSPLGLQNIDKLSFSAEGWGYTLYDQTVCLYVTQKDPVSLDATGSLKLSLRNIDTSHSSSLNTITLTATIYQIAPITFENLGTPISFSVSLLRPPQGQLDLHPDMSITSSRFNIISSTSSSQVNNQLALTFVHQGKTVLASQNTHFIISFVYAQDTDGYGALTTSSLADNIKITQGTNADNWKITPPGSKDTNPCWLLQPPSGAPIAGTGTQSAVQFDIKNIVTYFQPGPTIMTVAYSGIDGYADGIYPILLEKIAHAEITSFIATPQGPITLVKDAQGSIHAPVTLSWETKNTTSLSLNWASLNGEQDMTGKTEYKTIIARDTTFTLKANGEEADLDNYTIQNLTIQVKPVIDSFTITPPSLYSKGFPCNVSISWDATTLNPVRIQNNPNHLTSSGTLNNFKIQDKQSLPLTLIASGDDPSDINTTAKQTINPTLFDIDKPRFFSIPIETEKTPNANYYLSCIATTNSTSPILIASVWGSSMRGTERWGNTVGCFWHFYDVSFPFSLKSLRLLISSPTFYTSNRFLTSIAILQNSQLMLFAYFGTGFGNRETKVGVFQITEKGVLSSSPLQEVPVCYPPGEEIKSMKTSDNQKQVYLGINEIYNKTGHLTILQKEDNSNTFIKLPTTIPNISPNHITVAPDGKVFLSSFDGSSIIAVDPSNELHTTKIPLNANNNICHLTVSSSTSGSYQLLALCNNTNAILLIDPTTSTISQTYNIGFTAQEMFFLGPNYLLVLEKEKGELYLFYYNDNSSETYLIETLGGGYSFSFDQLFQNQYILLNNEQNLCVLSLKKNP